MSHRRDLAGGLGAVLLVLATSACAGGTAGSAGQAATEGPRIVAGGSVSDGSAGSPSSSASSGSESSGAEPSDTEPSDTEPSDTASASSETVDGGSTDTGSTDTGGSTDATNGPDFVLYSLPECALVLGGSPSGADALTLFVALRNSGPGSWSDGVPWSMQSSGGLSAGGTTGISEGTSTAAMQVDFDPAGYGSTQVFTITADPADTIGERDESNNSLQISVQLTARPSTSGDVPCSSP